MQFSRDIEEAACHISQSKMLETSDWLMWHAAASTCMLREKLHRGNPPLAINSRRRTHHFDPFHLLLVASAAIVIGIQRSKDPKMLAEWQGK